MKKDGKIGVGKQKMTCPGGIRNGFASPSL